MSQHFEVFNLKKQHPDALIIITHQVGQERAKTIQQHYSTTHLTASTTIADVLFELGFRTAIM